MDIKKLKHDTRLLPDINLHIDSFEKNWIKAIKANSNAHLPFLQKLDAKEKKEINRKLAALSKALLEIRHAQVINEKIASLAHLLVDLRIAELVKDYKKAKYILNASLYDPNSNIKKVIAEAEFLESQLGIFELSYKYVVRHLSGKLTKRQLDTACTKKQKKALKKLLEIPKQQKEHLHQLGTYFVEEARRLKKDRMFSKMFYGDKQVHQNILISIFFLLFHERKRKKD